MVEKTLAEDSEKRGSGEPTVATRWAWGLCWLMFASTVLNYMDRQSLALVGPQLRREFGIDFETFGWVLSAFSLTYALFQVPAGFLADAWPSWRVYAGAVALWSFAAMAAAFSPVLGALIALRALLGVGESFNWPCALRITGEILPPKDRSLGNGIFNSGAAVGAVLTPLFLPVLVQWFGWRAAFVVVGALGFVWVGVWMSVTRSWKTEQTETKAEAGKAGLSRRAKLGFGAVGVAGIATVVLGARWPAAVPVKLDRLRPEEPVVLVKWLVKPGEKLDRRRTEVAKVAVGEAQALWRAPEEGTVAKVEAKPGEEMGRGSKPLWINNSAETFAEEVDAVEPVGRALIKSWRVQPGDEVEKGAVLAELEYGGKGFLLISEHEGSVARFEVESGRAVGSGETALVEYVTGFEPKANGLPAITYGIAILLFGSLVVARVLPERELGSGWASRLGHVVRKRRFWILVLVTSSINVCWHFLVNWLPTYLQTDRQMRYLASGLFAALPFLAADAGNLGGGFASRWLAGRGLPADRARVRVMAVCSVLASAAAVVGWVRSDAAVIAVLCVVALGIAAFMANYFAFCQEVSSRHTGLVVGYLGAIGNFLAGVFNPLAGRIKDTTGSFSLVFVMVGVLPFVGLVALVLGWGKSEEGQKPAEISG